MTLLGFVRVCVCVCVCVCVSFVVRGRVGELGEGRWSKFEKDD